MPMRYKIDVLNALKEKGYNTNKIRTEGTSVSSTAYSFGSWTNKYVNVKTILKYLKIKH